MKQLYKNWIVIAGICLTGACGQEKDKDEEDDTAPTTSPTPTTPDPLASVTSSLNTGTLILGYAMASMSSASVSNSSLALQDSQSTKFSRCSNNGAAWDSATSNRMAPVNPGFAAENLYCQLNSDESPETIMGNLARNKRVLCDVEKMLGSVEYTNPGKVSTVSNLTLSTACGWSADDVAEMSGQMTATVTATSLEGGDWQRKLSIVVPRAVDFTLYMRSSDGIVSFKSVEAWSQADRAQLRLLGDSNDFIAADATGTRGTVVTIDLKNGILRAEDGDTYWGRRTRLYVKGSLDSSTGKFSELTDVQGLQGTFNKSGGSANSPSLYAEYATFKGTKADGIMTRSYRMACTGANNTCNFGSTLAGAITLSSNESSSACLKSGGCAGNDGLTLDAATDLAFLAIDATWDQNGGNRTAFQDWLATAKPLTFNTVTKAQVLD